MKQTTAVAISGGVDSLMTAYLLKEQGQQVIGIHFITGFEAASAYTRDPGTDKKHNVLKIGEQLGIPVEIVDIRDEFQEKIVGYFCRTYQSGQTPNPCMHCNPTIKFGTIAGPCAKNLAHRNWPPGIMPELKEIKTVITTCLKASTLKRISPTFWLA